MRVVDVPHGRGPRASPGGCDPLKPIRPAYPAHASRPLCQPNIPQSTSAHGTRPPAASSGSAARPFGSLPAERMLYGGAGSHTVRPAHAGHRQSDLGELNEFNFARCDAKLIPIVGLWMRG